MKTPERSDRLRLMSSVLEPVDNQALCDVITRTTATAHNEVEALPFSIALLEGRLPMESYVQQLLAYRLIHASLLQACQGSEHPTLRRLSAHVRDRVADLDDDIMFLPAHPLSPGQSGAARMLAADFVEWARTTPAALIGAMWVFEGAANGGIFMCRFLRDAFGLSERGCRYYFGNGFETAADWRQSKAIINGTVQSDWSLVAAGAWQTFQQVSELLQLLFVSSGAK